MIRSRVHGPRPSQLRGNSHKRSWCMLCASLVQATISSPEMLALPLPRDAEPVAPCHGQRAEPTGGSSLHHGAHRAAAPLLTQMLEGHCCEGRWDNVPERITLLILLLIHHTAKLSTECFLVSGPEVRILILRLNLDA